MRKRRAALRTWALLAALLGFLGAGAAYWFYHTTRLEYRLRRANEALQRGEWNEAERLALRLEAGGYEDQAHLLRGKTIFWQAKPYLEAGQSEHVLGLLEQALDEFNHIRGPEVRLEAAALSGQCLLFLEEPAEAERVLRFVVNRNPDHMDSHRALAAIYYDQGALTRAIMHCEEWARLDRRDGRPHRWMGHIYADLDQRPDAVKCFREALRRELGEQFAEDVRENLAAVQIRQTDFAGALETLDSCSPVVGDQAKLAALRGEALWGLGRAGEARSVLEKALAAHLESVELLRLRARLCLQDNEPQVAATLLERALGIKRHDEVGQ
jgi:tetratricopeptide (TPR) repeat protein